MDNRGLRRMLNMESLLYGVKSLAIGVPLGIALSFVLYRLFRVHINFTFSIPWAAVLICVAGVFAVTFVSMRYASGKLRRGNITEATRTVGV
jgi:putative ABC transport system permease protein